MHIVGGAVALGDATLTTDGELRPRHFLNGHLVFAARSIRRRLSNAVDAPTAPLTRGRLAIQEESAEVMLRNIRVQRLDPSCSKL